MKVESLGAKNFLTVESKTRGKEDFWQFLWKEIKEVDKKEKEAESALLDMITGKEVDPVELSMRISQADVSMKLLLRIRNKVLEAYQEIMRMQI